jgi:pantoate--beta-alanine ligase
VQLLSSIADWRNYASGVRASGKTVGLVPTLGALHAGHASLFQKAKSNGDDVLATIFLNPIQFSTKSDYENYPRLVEADRSLALASGVDCLVEPTLEEMWPDYPAPTPTKVTMEGVSDTLEGEGRPGHFNGVASVVSKLFNVTGPCRAYFGEKDFQQIAVIRQMIRDLAFDVEIVTCEIKRDANGLALSSRNARLSPEGVSRATCISQAIAVAQAEVECASELRNRMRTILKSGGAEIVYAEVVDNISLRPADDSEAGEYRAIITATIDGVRLLDNGPVTIKAKN